MELREYFLKPIHEIEMATTYLISAARTHVTGNHVDSDRYIRLADIAEIANWAQRIMGTQDPSIVPFAPKTLDPPVLPVDQRKKPRMPSEAMISSLIQRDGHHCRVCGIPVVSKPVIEAMRKTYPESARWAVGNASKHHALRVMWMQYDHIVPHSRGGETSLSNLIVTCAPCNFGRGSLTFSEARLKDPMEREPRQSDWSGLTEFLN